MGEEDDTRMLGSVAARPGGPPMIPVKRLRHLALFAADLEGQAAYYRDIIGLTEVGREADRIFLASEAGQLSIVLETGATPGLARLALDLPPDRDIAAVEHALRAAGLPAERCSDPAPGCSVALRTSDLDGRPIELHLALHCHDNRQPLPGIAPGKHPRQPAGCRQHLGHSPRLVPHHQRIAACRSHPHRIRRDSARRPEHPHTVAAVGLRPQFQNLTGELPRQQLDMGAGIGPHHFDHVGAGQIEHLPDFTQEAPATLLGCGRPLTAVTEIGKAHH